MLIAVYLLTGAFQKASTAWFQLKIYWKNSIQGKLRSLIPDEGEINLKSRSRKIKTCNDFLHKQNFYSPWSAEPLNNLSDFNMIWKSIIA